MYLTRNKKTELVETIYSFADCERKCQKELDTIVSKQLYTSFLVIHRILESLSVEIYLFVSFLGSYIYTLEDFDIIHNCLNKIRRIL